MYKKLSILITLFIAIITFISGYLYYTSHAHKEIETPKNLNVKTYTPKIRPATKQQTIQKEELISDNLYDENNSIPLSSIFDITKASEDIKEEINKIAYNSNIYFLTTINDKIFMIVENTDNENIIRHDIEFIEINSNNEIKYIPFGYYLVEGSKENEKWKYDWKTKLPLKHIKYKNNNKTEEIEYIETWNYSLDEPIKYELRNVNGKILSLRKETYNENNDIQSEQIMYDENENIKSRISINYTGANISNFTYYDYTKPEISTTILYEYEDGLKTKELNYSSEYKLRNTYIAEYMNGSRNIIKKFNPQNIEIANIILENIE